VVFTTETRPYLQGVVSPGTHEDRISPETVAALFTQLGKERFFSLRSSYRLAAHDLLEFVLTVDTGQRQKTAQTMGSGSRDAGGRHRA
jgi:hypothetical protein